MSNSLNPTHNIQVCVIIWWKQTSKLVQGCNCSSASFYCQITETVHMKMAAALCRNYTSPVCLCQGQQSERGLFGWYDEAHGPGGFVSPGCFGALVQQEQLLPCQPDWSQDGHCGKYAVIILKIVDHHDSVPLVWQFGWSLRIWSQVRHLRRTFLFFTFFKKQQLESHSNFDPPTKPCGAVEACLNPHAVSPAALFGFCCDLWTAWVRWHQVTWRVLWLPFYHVQSWPFC